MPRRKPQKLSFKPVVVRSCEESWGEMTGTLRERHCPLCDKKVHNFAAMTVAEIERLTLESGGHICARITRREDGTLVTLESSPRIPFAAQIAVSASLVLGAAGATAQTLSDKPMRESAVLTGTVLKADGSGPAAKALVLLRGLGNANAVATVDEKGGFSVVVAPGRYDILVSDRGGAAIKIPSADLHPGDQSLQTIRLESTIEYTTMGDIVGTRRSSFYFAIRHPWSYLKYLARKL